MRDLYRPFVQLSSLALVALVGCGSGEAAGAQSNEAPILVESYRAAPHTFGSKIEIQANVLPMKQVKIIPRVPGVIEEVLVEEGDWVEEGQVLARLEGQDYELALRQARANVIAAQANAKLAKIMASSASTQNERMKRLLESDSIAQSKAEQASDGYRMGQAKRDAALAQVQLAEVGLAAARLKLDYTVIQAPYAGLVIQRLMDAGEIVGAMPPGFIMILADTTQMKIAGNVNELDQRRVKAGTTATVRVHALDHQEIRGTVELVSPMVDPRTRTVGIRVVLDNSEGSLETGMSADIVLDLGQHQSLAIPSDALFRSDRSDGAEVFLIHEARAKRRELRIGLREGELVEVIEGLSEGDQVIRAGGSTLHDGQPVTVATEAAE